MRIEVAKRTIVLGKLIEKNVYDLDDLLDNTGLEKDKFLEKIKTDEFIGIVRITEDRQKKETRKEIGKAKTDYSNYTNKELKELIIIDNPEATIKDRATKDELIKMIEG